MNREERIKLARKIYVEERAVYKQRRNDWIDAFQQWRAALDAHYEDRENNPSPTGGRPMEPEPKWLVRIMAELNVSRRTALEYEETIRYLESKEDG